MAASVDKTDRRVIPRWRQFRLTAALGELGAPGGISSLSTVPRPVPDTSRLTRLVKDWEENRSLSFAADLVGAAIVSGAPASAREAAEFIVSLGEQAPTSAMGLARAALGLQTPDIASLLPTSPNIETLSRTVSTLKARLREFPRNPVLLVDLSRIYTLLGQSEPAVRAMRSALALAPNNRFVLRSAARFFLHLKDHKSAYSVLRAAEVTPHDPWLLAAEIAVASAIGRMPQFVKEGEKMLLRAESAPFHVSELASAIGTIKLMEGKLRKARQLFREALRLPTDNALAQAQWAAVNQAGFVLTQDNLERPRSFEARSLVHRARGEWEPALAEATKWLYDEPFSRYAAASASYLASVPLERYEEAIELARLGLEATPRDPLLLNNLTFALASSGRLEEAEEAFRLIGREQSESRTLRATLEATRGLLFYRRGDIVQGRLHYEHAVEEARKEGDEFRVALALLYHAREALLAAAPNAQEVWMAAQKQTGKARELEIPLLQRRYEPKATKEEARRGTGDR